MTTLNDAINAMSGKELTITRDNESVIIMSMNYIIEIVKEVYKNNPSATVTDFMKTLNVEMCKYGMPDNTLLEIASCYVNTVYN